MHNEKSSCCDSENHNHVRVDVDVTKIVKYSCISSVIILLIIFGSKVLRELIKSK